MVIIQSNLLIFLVKTVAEFFKKCVYIGVLVTSVFSGTHNTI